MPMFNVNIYCNLKINTTSFTKQIPLYTRHSGSKIRILTSAQTTASLLSCVAVGDIHDNQINVSHSPAG